MPTFFEEEISVVGEHSIPRKKMIRREVGDINLTAPILLFNDMLYYY